MFYKLGIGYCRLGKVNRLGKDYKFWLIFL